MGTRSDFYLKNGNEVQWLGSASHDGYCWYENNTFGNVTTIEEFQQELDEIRMNGSWVRSDTWPWPWDDSNLTDYVYVYENGRVDVYIFGHGPQPAYDMDVPTRYSLQPEATWFPLMCNGDERKGVRVREALVARQ